MQPAFQTVVSLHNDVLGPLEKTTPSGEFTAAMLAFTVYNLCRNPTFSRVMVSAAFMAWPRLVTYLCKERPALRNLGMQLFNAVLVRNNPVGIVAGIAACWLAHKCTVFLPPQMHQGVRTAAFLGAMVGGARCYAS